MKSTEEIRTEFNAVPVNRFFGFELVARSAEHAEVVMTIDPDHLQEEGIVQGGVITALADTAGVYLLYPDLPTDRSMTGIEFKMNFLSPATVGRGRVRARSRLVKGGRRISVVEVEVFQGERLVAMGVFTHLLFERR